jgi:virginiamycin A acetyltransferase
VMPGVRVGNGAIISSRSVVVHDVPAYTVVGGNPAVAIKQRFAPELVEILETIAWWDWPIEKVTRHLDAIVSGDIAALQARSREV